MQTAAEWLDERERYIAEEQARSGYLPYHLEIELRHIQMLRGAKAELDWRPSTGERVQVDGYDETGIYCNGFHGTVLGHVGACCMLVKLDEGRGNVTVGWRQLSRVDGGWSAIEAKFQRGGYR